MQVDTTGWSGEGSFTATMLDQLQRLADIEFIRVEDAPASHTEAHYSFISNEVYVRFRSQEVDAPGRLLGVLPVRRRLVRPAMTLDELERQLTGMPNVGPADYSDEGMLQYLKAERVVPPYQTRGYKVVELVRIYRLIA